MQICLMYSCAYIMYTHFVNYAKNNNCEKFSCANKHEESTQLLVNQTHCSQIPAALTQSIFP